jgi:hypothetical protein
MNADRSCNPRSPPGSNGYYANHRSNDSSTKIGILSIIQSRRSNRAFKTNKSQGQIRSSEAQNSELLQRKLAGVITSTSGQ